MRKFHEPSPLCLSQDGEYCLVGALDYSGELKEKGNDLISVECWFNMLLLISVLNCTWLSNLYSLLLYLDFQVLSLATCMGGSST